MTDLNAACVQPLGGSQPGNSSEHRDNSTARRDRQRVGSKARKRGRSGAPDAYHAPVPLSEGESFAGYTIEHLLGAGGMGEVYLARHPRLPRHDALKVLRADVSADDDFRVRFVQEADLASALSHPNIVTVHDRGEFDDQLWISTAYIKGTDAAQLQRNRYPLGLPADEVASIIEAVASALDYAHGQGLLHRDVKPANVLLSELDRIGERRVFLADFGIARPLGDPCGLTATNMTVGTVAYSAPEQLMGEPLDGRADQYALAASAYHLLTGTLLFPHSNPAVVISRHLTAPVPALADGRPDLASFDPILAAALAKNPNDRFASCVDFARALKEAVSPQTTRGPVAPTAPAQVAHRPQTPPNFDKAVGATGQGDDSARSARRRLLVFSVVTALLMLGGIGLWWRPWPNTQSGTIAISTSNAPTTSTLTGTQPAALLPEEPPANSGCSGDVVGHSDAKHPQLGMVRAFLFLDRSLRIAGCVLPITDTGRVLPPIGVNAFVGDGFGFANPSTDATGNTFVKYRDASNSNYSDGGVVVLVPKADGFENVVSYNKMEQGGGDAFLIGVNDYYSVELIGPVDGAYTIRQTANTCDPDCASGRLAVRTLRWDGNGYVPESVPLVPPPVAETASPTAPSSIAPSPTATPTTTAKPSPVPEPVDPASWICDSVRAGVAPGKAMAAAQDRFGITQAEAFIAYGKCA